MEKIATFAGGCFWCMVKPYNYYSGVKDVVSGYVGGNTVNPSYKEVSTGDTGHFEAVQITYDDKEISYSELLDIFWKQIDPFDNSGQFADRGSQYMTAIFYHDDEQREIATKSIEKLEKNTGRKVATKVLESSLFYPAEDYHQNYYEKNPRHYDMYYKNSGRHNFLKTSWDRNNIDDNKKNSLTSIQYEVTQNDMTEIPFENEYYSNFDKGIYVDIVDGSPLFLSSDKFESGCGWPAFSKPIKDSAILMRTDFSFGMNRTEVRSLRANSHLGHVFNDGIETLGGQRYCINSASLKFIPFDKMDEEGYGEYKKLIK